MYAMLCTRPDICFAMGIVSRFQSKPGPDHWMAVKHIFKYLRRTRDNMLVYSGGDLIPVGYTDSNFQSDSDYQKIHIRICVYYWKRNSHMEEYQAILYC